MSLLFVLNLFWSFFFLFFFSDNDVPGNQKKSTQELIEDEPRKQKSIEEKGTQKEKKRTTETEKVKVNLRTDKDKERTDKEEKQTNNKREETEIKKKRKREDDTLQKSKKIQTENEKEAKPFVFHSLKNEIESKFLRTEERKENNNFEENLDILFSLGATGGGKISEFHLSL